VPLKQNRPEYSRELVREVRDIRGNDHTCPARKIRLRRDKPYLDIPSRAAVGRLISRENLYFRADIERRRKQSKAAEDVRKRRRKPLRDSASREAAESGMKHINLSGAKPCAFCAPDNGSREGIIHAA
jgi:hypothetical protein